VLLRERGDVVAQPWLEAPFRLRTVAVGRWSLPAGNRRVVTPQIVSDLGAAVAVFVR
jgi:hypothetical protein